MKFTFKKNKKTSALEAIWKFAISFSSWPNSQVDGRAARIWCKQQFSIHVCGCLWSCEAIKENKWNIWTAREQESSLKRNKDKNKSLFYMYIRGWEVFLAIRNSRVARWWKAPGRRFQFRSRRRRCRWPGLAFSQSKNRRRLQLERRQVPCQYHPIHRWRHRGTRQTWQAMQRQSLSRPQRSRRTPLFENRSESPTMTRTVLYARQIFCHASSDYTAQTR